MRDDAARRRAEADQLWLQVLELFRPLAERVVRWLDEQHDKEDLMALHAGNPGVWLSDETYDRFHDAYVALVNALHEARPYVDSFCSDPKSLERIDSALAMEANLEARVETESSLGPYDDPSCPPDTEAP